MLEPGLWTGPEVPGDTAVLLEDGTAAAPADAPTQVKQAIWAANSLQQLPYRYGGGHNLKFDVAKGADCSGTVSFALKAAGVLEGAARLRLVHEVGRRGKGAWITVYTNPGHAYAIIAGLRLDTSSAPAPTRARPRASPASAFERGPRWRPMDAPGARASSSATRSRSKRRAPRLHSAGTLG